MAFSPVSIFELWWPAVDTVLQQVVFIHWVEPCGGKKKKTNTKTAFLLLAGTLPVSASQKESSHFWNFFASSTHLI